MAVFHKPDWFVSLNDVQHISPTICASEQEYEFVLTLSTEVIRLAAPTWDQMHEWVEALRGKLYELRILSPKENLYTKLPDRSLPLLSTRDPTSPLPPTPAVPPEFTPGIEPLNTEAPSVVTVVSHRRRSESQSGISRRSSNASDIPRRQATRHDVFNFEQFNDILEPPSSAPSNITTQYEFLFQMQQNPGKKIIYD